MSRSRNFVALMNALVAEFRSQLALATRLGVGEPTISKWRGGRVPNTTNLGSVCALANIESADLEREEGEFALLLEDGVRGLGVSDATYSISALDAARGRRPEEIAGLKGTYRYIYTLRHGAFCIGELEIVRALPTGIQTRVVNVDDTADVVGSRYTYNGRGFIIGDFLYLILGEAEKGSELLFATIRLPVGGNNRVMYGHLLARGYRDGENKSAVSPTMLVSMEVMGEHADLFGEVDAETMVSRGLLSKRGLTYLSDLPALSLYQKLRATGAID